MPHSRAETLRFKTITVADLAFPKREGGYTKGHATREQILHAALVILIKEGYTALSMRRVAAACDMKLGNLTYHFRTREDLVRELLDAGLAHEDVLTVAEGGMRAYATEPTMDDDKLTWKPAPETSGDDTMLRTVANAFQSDGGMRLVEGNLGRATFKTSAVEKERWTIEAPCRVFDTQEAVAKAFAAGELDRDVVVVVRFQGPRANGMPELHKLTPPLGVLQDRGHRVALVTDGRMSGASGKVPAAIHVTPEALATVTGEWGPLAYLQDGDIVRLSGETGELSTTADLSTREPASPPEDAMGMGRELFAMFRLNAGGAEQGGSAMLELAGL